MFKVPAGQLLEEKSVLDFCSSVLRVWPSPVARVSVRRDYYDLIAIHSIIFALRAARAGDSKGQMEGLKGWKFESFFGQPT